MLYLYQCLPQLTDSLSCCQHGCLGVNAYQTGHSSFLCGSFHGCTRFHLSLRQTTQSTAWRTSSSNHSTTAHNCWSSDFCTSNKKLNFFFAPLHGEILIEFPMKSPGTCSHTTEPTHYWFNFINNQLKGYCILCLWSVMSDVQIYIGAFWILSRIQFFTAVFFFLIHFLLVVIFHSFRHLLIFFRQSRQAFFQHYIVYKLVPSDICLLSLFASNKIYFLNYDLHDKNVKQYKLCNFIASLLNLMIVDQKMNSAPSNLFIWTLWNSQCSCNCLWLLFKKQVYFLIKGLQILPNICSNLTFIKCW